MCLLRRGRLGGEARVLDHDAATAVGIAALWFLPVAAAGAAGASATVRVAPAAANQRRRLLLLLVVLVLLMLIGGRRDDDGPAGTAGANGGANGDGTTDGNTDHLVVLLGQFPPRADSGLPFASARRQ